MSRCIESAATLSVRRGVHSARLRKQVSWRFRGQVFETASEYLESDTHYMAGARDARLSRSCGPLQCAVASVDRQQVSMPTEKSAQTERWLLGRWAFVGREAEVQQLRSAFNAASNGHGALMVLAGE